MLSHTSGSFQGPLVLVVLVIDRKRWSGLVGEAEMTSGDVACGEIGESVILLLMASLRASVLQDASRTSCVNNDFGAMRPASRRMTASISYQ